MVLISNLKAASNLKQVDRQHTKRIRIFLSSSQAKGLIITVVLTLMCLSVVPSVARLQTAPTEKLSLTTVPTVEAIPSAHEKVDIDNAGMLKPRSRGACLDGGYTSSTKVAKSPLSERLATDRKTITHIVYEVDGERVTDANTVAMLRERTRIRVGERFSRHLVYRSVVSLYASAQFSTVKVYARGIHPPVARFQTAPTEGGNAPTEGGNNNAGVSLRFSLSSVMRIADIETLGVPAALRSPLEKVMQQPGRLQAGSPYHPDAAQRDMAAIKTECAHWGYFGATVKATFSQETGNLTYALTLGAPSRISDIRIQEKNNDRKRNEKVDIDNVDVGLRRGMPRHQPSSPNASRLTENRKGAVYRRTAVERDADALVALYRKRGYLAATVQHTFTPETGILQWTVDAGKRLDIMIVNPDPGTLDDAVQLKDVHEPKLRELIASLRKSPFLWQQQVTAYFEGKGYDGTRVEVVETARKITFTIRLGTRYVVTRVTFSGNRAFSSEDLLREMQTKPQGFLARRLRKRFFSQETLNIDAARLRILYQNAGYPDVKIEHTLKTYAPHEVGMLPDGEGHIEIHVQVVESAREVIYRCEFQGNRALSVNTLLDALQAVGFSPPQPNARFIRNDYRNAVLRAYQERGYMDATVEVRYVAKTERPVFQREGAAAEQGIAALHAGRLSEELRALIGIKTFTLTQMGNLWRLQDSGGIARYTLQEGQTKGGESLLLVFEHHLLRVAISEGHPVYFGAFTFTGDAGVRSGVLTREVQHLVGTLWTPAALSEAVRRLYNTGIFRRISVVNEKVDIDQSYPRLRGVDFNVDGGYTSRTKVAKSPLSERLATDRKNEKVDIDNVDVGYTSRHVIAQTPLSERLANDRKVVVEVEKQKAGSYQAGLGYSTTDGFRTTLALQHRNLYKRNIGVSLRGRAGVRAGTLGYLLAGRLTKPWLFGRNRGTLQVSERQLEADDNVRVRQSRLTLSRELSNALLVQCDYSYRFLRQVQNENNEKVVIDNVNDGDTSRHAIAQTPLSERLANDRKTTVSSVRLLWRYDSRLPFLNPTAGVLNEVTLEYAGGFLQGETSFIKSTFDVRCYRELVKDGLTVATALRLGVTNGLRRNRDTELISFERFWAGGSSTVRGYAERSLGPLDSAGNHRGDVQFIFNTELRFPIYKPIRGVLFFDTGTVWRSLKTFAENLPGDGEKLPAAVGIGIRLKWGAFTGGADYAVLVRDIPAATVTPFSLRLGSTF